MAKLWEGKPDGGGRRFGIVAGRFNSTVTDKLLEGALEGLRRSGVDEDDVEVVRVPGAFEIPIAAKRLGESGRVAAIVCVGAIIKGGTPHWDYLADAVTTAMAELALQVNLPVTNALLTTETVEQAAERAGRGTGSENKGFDAALAAVEMAELFSRLSEK